MRRFVLMPCLIAAIGVGLVLLARWSGVAVRGSPPQNASLLLLGRTNLPAGNFAVFCLTNGTRMDLGCMPWTVEQPSASGWLSTSVNGNAWRVTRDWIGVPGALKPGQGFSFMVPAPATNGTWRLVFRCQEQRRLIDPVIDKVRHITDTNAIKSNSRQFSGRWYYVTSPEVRTADGGKPNSTP